jgi:tetratricopeptide (TPR) repeat protein
MPVCGNCHSFSRDGSVLAMDVDSGGDKGAYAITPITEQIFLTREKLITWKDFRRGQGSDSFGLLAQVSPDGRFVAATVKDRVIFLGQEGAKIEFSQLFFPVKGIIAFYDREKKQILPLPGADDPNVCQANPSWSPDCKYIIFARAPLREFIKKDQTKNPVLTREQSVILLGGEKYLEDYTGAPAYTFSLYRLPFNEGKGGKPEPVPGAAENGVSNYFARYSPDGKWIMFCRARSFMLLQPDSRLWIMPADFSQQPRELTYQTRQLNSWHSWSPNSRWIVFSSKEHSGYTELFLKHIDENGSDSPPVRLSAFSSPDRARNIPEFVNIRQGGIKRIYESFVDYYSYMRKGETLENLGKTKEAEESYRKSLEMNPNFAETHRKLAFMLRRENRLEDAQKEFEATLKLEPKDPPGHQNIGDIYFAKKDYDKAMSEYETCLKIDPRYSPAHSGMGMIFLAKGDTPRARPYLETAVKLDPDDANAQYSLAVIYVEQKEYDKAEQAIKMAQHSEKYNYNSNPETYSRLGTVYLLKRDFGKAEQAFLSALKLDPENSEALHNLGIIYLNRNDLSSAERVFRKVYKLNQENPWVCMMLAQVLARNEKTLSEAITLYNKALLLDPGNTQGYVDLGNIYLSTGDRVNALHAFEKALELSPGDRRLKSQVETLKPQR